MRVAGLNGAGTASAPSAARRAGGSGFSLGENEATRASAGTKGPRAIASLDALLALQSVEDATERRKRFVRHGRGALDTLDTLKLGLLDGDLDPSTIGRLKSAAESLKASSGDPGLDAVLAEIGLRVEVELAKASRN